MATKMGKQSTRVPQQPEWLPPDCKLCQEVWRGLISPSPGIKIDLGGREAEASTQCPVHKPLLEHLNGYKGTILSRKSATKGFADDGIRDAQDRSRRAHWNLLVKKQNIADHPGVGRLLDPEWIDPRLARSWKEKCIASHGAQCSNPMGIPLARPAWLIDVNQGCLVDGRDTDGPYVALSYIYGRIAGTVVTTEILARLRKAGALTGADPEVVSEYVAPITTHAMSLTSALGERYLWADSLCVPCQDPNKQAEQLNLMGKIYASAIVTVVSLSGDAMDGLPGIQGVSNPRRLKQLAVEFGNEQLVIHTPWTDPDQDWSRLPYFERGWTHQEYQLSPRKLIFFNNQIHWVCSEACFHEDMTISTKALKLSGHNRDETSSIRATGREGRQREHLLSQMIQRYCVKQLRYDEDAFPAISGTLSALCRSFPGGFLYGIPELLFEWGLCWTPDHAAAELRRRKPSSRSPERRLHPSELPSWSWVGWQGSIAMSSRVEDPPLHPGLHPTHAVVKCETLAIAQWFTGASPRVPPESRRSIASSFLRTTVAAEGEEPEPPNHPQPAPNPSTAVEESEVPFVPDQTAFLFCDTARTRLLGRLDDYNVVTLTNSTEYPVGYLHLHTHRDANLFLEDASGAGLWIDLIAVCKLRIHYLNKTTLERYAVLWVEWKDGVAYRRASGEVDAKAWDDLGPEDVSVVLG